MGTHVLKRFAPGLLVLLLLAPLMMLGGCDRMSGRSSGHVTDAQMKGEALYEEAWQLIRAEYVDGSFNGQNWDTWRYRFKGDIHDLDDAHVAIGTMVASLNDEYTRFLLPKSMKEQTMSIDSRLFGVGIQIAVRDHKLMVMSVLDETPAKMGGLMPKDLIMAIDGDVSTGFTVEQAAERIRGPEGTPVVLTIKRGDKKEFQVRLKRAEIKLKSVFTRELDDKRIGYIRISSFISENMEAELLEILTRLKNKEAIIIDLRGNYGGLFANAVEIADLLLEDGKIVSVTNRAGQNRVYMADPQVLYRKPVVVLIDGGSASASEILSGALKDNNRAELIGTQSFGKGLVQKINEMSYGAGMNITISKYFTPAGTDINKKGIAPDIRVRFTEADLKARRDPQLKEAVSFLKKKIAS